MEKCYSFTISSSGVGKGYVFAESLEEAREKIEAGEWDDIIDEDTTYEDIIEIWED